MFKERSQPLTIFLLQSILGAKNDQVLNLFILFLQMHRNSLPWVPLVPGGFVRNVLWSSSLAPIAKGNIVQTHLFNSSIHTQNYFQNHTCIYSHGIVQASIVFLWSIARDYSICSTSSMETLWTSPRWILYPPVPLVAVVAQVYINTLGKGGIRCVITW